MITYVTTLQVALSLLNIVKRAFLRFVAKQFPLKATAGSMM